MSLFVCTLNHDAGSGSAGELNGHRATLNSSTGSDLVRFHGYGENPNLTVGMMIGVTGQKLVKPGQYKQESVGNYRLTNVNHYVDVENNYANDFRAVPASASYPPHNPYVHAPVALPEIATVITNEDPKQLGRVKVQFHWPNQLAGKSSWVRVAMPYTGGAKGSLFIPEKDDQVLLSYEANHVDFPVVVGSLYHKDPAVNYWFDNNYQKILRTKGGNKIVFKDEPGKQEIFITNANNKGTGIHINFTDEGVISIYTKGLVDIQAKNITMHATENVKITADQEMLLHGGSKIEQTGPTLNMFGDKKVEVNAPDVDIYEI